MKDVQEDCSILDAIRSAYKGGYYRKGVYNHFEISRDIGFLLAAFDAAVSCKDDYRAKLIRALNGHTDDENP